jgi:hypothetical protein
MSGWLGGSHKYSNGSLKDAKKNSGWLRGENTKKASTEREKLAVTVKQELIESNAKVIRFAEIISALMIADETGYIDGEGWLEGYDEIVNEANEVLDNIDTYRKINNTVELKS